MQSARQVFGVCSYMFVLQTSPRRPTRSTSRRRSSTRVAPSLLHRSSRLEDCSYPNTTSPTLTHSTCCRTPQPTSHLPRRTAPCEQVPQGPPLTLEHGIAILDLLRCQAPMSDRAPVHTLCSVVLSLPSSAALITPRRTFNMVSFLLLHHRHHLSTLPNRLIRVLGMKRVNPELVTLVNA